MNARLIILALLPLAPVETLDDRPRVAAVAPGRQMDYRFPAGTTYWTVPYVVEGQVGMTLTGTRSNGVPSRMVYRGPPGKAVFSFVGCTRCKLVDLEIVDESGCDATVLITNAVDPPNTGFSTGNLISNVRVLIGTTGKTSKRAFSVDSYAAGGRDANNDHHRFSDCYAQSYAESGYYIRGSQCHDLLYERCHAHDAGGRKPIGFHAAEGVFLRLTQCAMNSNRIDIKLDAAEIQLVADGINSENAEQFLTYPHSFGLPHVNASNVQWRGKPVVGKPVADVAGGGPWTFTNWQLSGINGVYPTIRIAGSGIGSVDLSGVVLRQHGGTTPTAAIVTAPIGFDVSARGMRYQRINEDGGRVDRVVRVNQAVGVAQ